MISSITSVLTGIEQPDGQTIANARGFTDNDDNGALNVEMGEDWSGEEEVYVPNMYYAVSLAANTTYTIDLNGSVYEYPAVRFTDQNNQLQGTAMVIDDMDYPPTVTPASFTPNKAGIYYIHVAYGNEWTTIPLLVSPRPQEKSLATRHLWDTVQGQVNNGVPVGSDRVSNLSPVFVLPLLTNTTPTLNTKSLEISTEGTVTFDGNSCVTQSSYLKVKMTPLMFNDCTYAFAFNTAATGDVLTRLRAGEDFMALIASSGTGGQTNVGNNMAFSYYSNDHNRNTFLYDFNGPVATGRWHTLVVSIDVGNKEVRAMFDGKITGRRTIPVAEYDTRVWLWSGNAGIGFRDVAKGGDLYLKLGENSAESHYKNLMMWDMAMDYSQMMSLKSKLLS